MQLIEVKAQAGYLWFRQGIWLFRRNPLAFMMMFFTYIFAMLLVSLVPLIGEPSAEAAPAMRMPADAVVVPK